MNTTTNKTLILRKQFLSKRLILPFRWETCSRPSKDRGMVTHFDGWPGQLSALSSSSTAPFFFFSFLTSESTAFSAHFSSSSPCFHPSNFLTAGDVKLKSELRVLISCFTGLNYENEARFGNMRRGAILYITIKLNNPFIVCCCIDYYSALLTFFSHNRFLACTIAATATIASVAEGSFISNALCIFYLSLIATHLLDVNLLVVISHLHSQALATTLNLQLFINKVCQ